jgi:hypothetical protein
MENRKRHRDSAARQIRHNLAQITPENAHPQLQSSVFKMLPPELRHEIFRLALTPDIDRSRGLWGASGWKTLYPHSICCEKIFAENWHPNLLLTCRRVYLEANAIPMRNAVIVVPPVRKIFGIYGRPDFTRYTAKNSHELNHVHIIDEKLSPDTQRRLFHAPQFRPRVITLSARLDVLRSTQEFGDWLWLDFFPFSGPHYDSFKSTSFQLISFQRLLPDSLQELRLQLQQPLQEDESNNILDWWKFLTHDIGPQYVNLGNHHRLCCLRAVRWSSWRPPQGNRFLDEGEHPIEGCNFTGADGDSGRGKALEHFRKWLEQQTGKGRADNDMLVATLTYSPVPGVPDWKDDDYPGFALAPLQKKQSDPDGVWGQPVRMPEDLASFFREAIAGDW